MSETAGGTRAQLVGPASFVALRRGVVDMRGLKGQSLEAMRLLVVGDVLRRIVHTYGHARLDMVILGDDETPVSRATARALAVQQAHLFACSPSDVASALGGRPDVVFAAASTLPPGPGGGCGGLADAWPPDTARVQVGAVDATGSRSAGPEILAELVASHDPLAVRLALLRFFYPEDAQLSLARLKRAEETLRRWRRKIADWSDMPTGAASAAQVALMRRALLTRADTGAVLTLLHRLETQPRVVSGSKFAAFAHCERVLALDLGHSIGARGGHTGAGLLPREPYRPDPEEGRDGST